MKLQRSKPDRERGGSVAEFALLAPVFVVLLFGMVEFGLAMYAKGVITNASREGARLGVVYGTPRKTEAEIIARIREYLNKAGFYATPEVTIDVTGEGGSSGTTLTVSVSYPYTFQVLPRFVQGLTGTRNISANTKMLME
uniref:Pilus assembly protein n=1 Tax=Desulfobacca acetoxidans TaxID=60893 RepID=A0A7V4LBW8_9BACT